MLSMRLVAESVRNLGIFTSKRQSEMMLKIDERL